VAVNIETEQPVGFKSLPYTWDRSRFFGYTQNTQSFKLFADGSINHPSQFVNSRVLLRIVACGSELVGPFVIKDFFFPYGEQCLPSFCIDRTPRPPAIF